MKIIAVFVLLLYSTATLATPSRQTGIASWYGPGFEGKKTSNGETFTGQQYHRLIDLSKKAAEHLDMQQAGTAKVQVDVLTVAPPVTAKGVIKPSLVKYSALRCKP